MSESARDLLAAIARALAEDVAPHVGDPFAQMQCRAAAELLGNLSEELDWAPDPIRAENARLSALLDALREAGWPGVSAAAGDSGRSAPEPAAAREALLEEVARALRWVSNRDRTDAAATAADRLLRADLERQVAALRRGMFRE